MSSVTVNHQQVVEELDVNGFTVIKDALSPEQVATLNQAVDRFREEHPEQWVGLSDSQRQAPNVLPWTGEFDFVIENPKILGILGRVYEDDLAYEDFGIMIREPTQDLRDPRGWHRDLTRDHARRKEIQAIQVIYYLTAVSENDHCLTIVPESHNRLIDLRVEEVQPGEGREIQAPAGSAVIFHVRCIHAGRLKPKSRQRRTLHLYYAHGGLPRITEWSEIPERLYKKVDPALPPHFYSKWNATEIFEGTGKKPRDMAPNTPTVEAVKEVQRRAREQVERSRRELLGVPSAAGCESPRTSYNPKHENTARAQSIRRGTACCARLLSDLDVGRVKM